MYWRSWIFQTRMHFHWKNMIKTIKNCTILLSPCLNESMFKHDHSILHRTKVPHYPIGCKFLLSFFCVDLYLRQLSNSLNTGMTPKALIYL